MFLDYCIAILWLTTFFLTILFAIHYKEAKIKSNIKSSKKFKINGYISGILFVISNILMLIYYQ